MRAGISAVIVSLGTLTLLSAPTARGAYVFVNVADNTGSYTGFDAPTINDNDGVAFRATIGAFSQGIFRGPNPVVHTVGSSDYAAFGFSQPVINNAGTIVFRAINGATGDRGVYTGPDRVADAFVTTAGAYATIEGPTINNAGTILFYADEDGFVKRGHYSGPNPAADRRIDMALFAGSGTLAAINDSGVIAFWGGNGIYKGTSNLDDVAVATEVGPLAGFGTNVTINNSGVVVFTAFLDSGGNGIFRGPNPATDTIADTLGPFASFELADINDSGQVAFLATLDAGGTGIYTGSNPATDKVIATGDPLFGSTITSLNFFRGLNNHGDVGFAYELANGRKGVAIANVPEPAALALVTAAAGTIVGSRNRRRRSNLR